MFYPSFVPLRSLKCVACGFHTGPSAVPKVHGENQGSRLHVGEVDAPLKVGVGSTLS